MSSFYFWHWRICVLMRLNKGAFSECRNLKSVEIPSEVEVIEDAFDDDLSATSHSFGYFIGAGVEADLGESNWMLGGEIRYQGFQFDTAKYDIDGISGKEDYSYLSFMAKVGYKF